MKNHHTSATLPTNHCQLLSLARYTASNNVVCTLQLQSHPSPGRPRDQSRNSWRPLRPLWPVAL